MCVPGGSGRGGVISVGQWVFVSLHWMWNILYYFHYEKILTAPGYLHFKHTVCFCYVTVQITWYHYKMIISLLLLLKLTHTISTMLLLWLIISLLVFTQCTVLVKRCLCVKYVAKNLCAEQSCINTLIHIAEKGHTYVMYVIRIFQRKLLWKNIIVYTQVKNHSLVRCAIKASQKVVIFQSIDAHILVRSRIYVDCVMFISQINWSWHNMLVIRQIKCHLIVTYVRKGLEKAGTLLNIDVDMQETSHIPVTCVIRSFLIRDFWKNIIGFTRVRDHSNVTYAVKSLLRVVIFLHTDEATQGRSHLVVTCVVRNFPWNRNWRNILVSTQETRQ
jgi:hypothetical protein